MKKFLSFMAILMAVVLTMSSCKKDEETDSEANRLKFANAMLQNKTSYAWEGPQSAHVKNEGVKKERYAVLLFKRADEKSTTGTGRILLFTNSFKTELDESSEFRWYFSNDCLYMEWSHSGWKTQHAEYRTKELVIDGNGFRGKWFESTSYWWEFEYRASSFNEWDKYPLNK